MKKWMIGLLLGLVVMFSAGIAEAGTMFHTDVTLASGTTSLAVASTTTVYTKSYDISDAEYFSVMYYAAAGTANVTIQIEQSWTKPATEGAADGNWTIPVNMADIVTALTTEGTVYVKAINPIAMRYIRFKITGNSGNDAGTVLTMRIGRKQD